MKLYCVVLLCAGLLIASASGQRGNAGDHCVWLEKSLSNIETIHVGMTRVDLEKLFPTEGGIYMQSRRTYVYRDCPYIKVDVEFAPAGQNQNSSDTITQNSSDTITKISKPYIARPIPD